MADGEEPQVADGIVGQIATGDGAVAGITVPVAASASNSSLGDGAAFDFTLTGPMWWEFAMASNAYGRGVRKIFLPGAIFCTVILAILCDKWVDDGEDAWLLVCILVLTCACWLFCGGPLARWGVANKLAALVSVWFPVPSTSGAEMRSALAQWKDGSFDSRWGTPSRLLVEDDGLTWMWSVSGDVRSTSVRWADLDCVRLTEHAVVLSPSAGGKASMDIVPEVPDVRFADLDGCVMVDRSVLPDVDGFVSWCREQVAGAYRGARHASGGAPSRGPGALAVWWGRFRRWLYGDDEFLDGPPKNWLHGMGFRSGSGPSD